MKYNLSLLVFASLSLLAFPGCSGRKSASSDDGSSGPSVSVVTVQRAEVPRLCEVPGTVVPKNQAVVSARVTGTVQNADFAIGELVKKGQVLVVLSAPEMQARVDQAQAAVDKARRDYERESGLLKSGASTGQTVRDMAEALRIAEASLAEVRTLNSYTRIEAPFDGRIFRKLVNEGDFAAPGTPLFEIDGENGLRVAAPIPESFPDMEIGSKLGVSTGGVVKTGVLAEFSPAADPQSRTRLAKVDLAPGDGFRSGQFVRLLWPVGAMNEIRVPMSALSDFGQIHRVYVVADGRAHMRVVRTGEARDGLVQILSGLDDGERIVVAPPAGLRNAEKVEVR